MGPESKKFPVGLSDTLSPRSWGGRAWLLAKGDSGPEQGQPEPRPQSWASEGSQKVPTGLALCDTCFRP